MHWMRTLPAAVTATLERFRTLLSARFGQRVVEIKLFGSWALGSANEESDVDVFVAIDSLNADERQEVLELAYQADAPNDWLVLLSPLVYSTAQAAQMRAGGRRLFRDIDGQGIAL
jgi:predicted nucleotidyltransferase